MNEMTGIGSRVVRVCNVIKLTNYNQESNNIRFSDSSYKRAVTVLLVEKGYITS